MKTITLERYREQYEKLLVKKTLTGDKALAAVKQNGDALRYVGEQMFSMKIEMENAK